MGDGSAEKAVLRVGQLSRPRRSSCHLCLTAKEHGETGELEELPRSVRGGQFTHEAAKVCSQSLTTVSAG